MSGGEIARELRAFAGHFSDRTAEKQTKA